MKSSIKKRILNLYFILLIFLFCSCAPAYVPNVINSPLFSNGGELHASVYVGTSGTDPQLAFAITDNPGIMVNGSIAERTSELSSDYHKHEFIEFGAGYYDRIKNKGRFEVFGGFGVGKLQAHFENHIWSSYTDVKSRRYFLQPAIGVTGNIADFSSALRFVAIDLYQGPNNDLGIFCEPAITGKLGYKYVKAIMQFGFSFPLNPYKIDFHYQPVMISFGIQANIGKNYNE